MLAFDDAAAYRPQSVAVPPSSSQSRDRDRDRKRASHAPTSSHAHDENQYPIRDVYQHPAALAYAQAHPRRTIPRFGPYLLLQTIGEGEFGKVKLGLHSQWGEEVAVKLIRRGSVDSTVRMSKVEREIDVLKTSCGSPCYAAPELVISEGMYVGSAVDIWSCGVILYAMLAGYLPFDDDPANPDGDNINLLYKYIINTPLTFPDYISDDARDLLSKMLVPDPTRRADLDTIMNHHWLRTYRHFFDRTVEECEEAAVLQYEQKRQEYSRKLRARQPDEESSHRSRRAERATLADTSAPMSESALANHSMDVDAASTNSRRAQAVSAIVDVYLGRVLRIERAKCAESGPIAPFTMWLSSSFERVASPQFSRIQNARFWPVKCYFGSRVSNILADIAHPAAI
ncbi:Pkinase-domain-containing protein [Exidia glandulosa HHB12029]|uniref:Pkinase-domain-containing protein n=1 Tax=Exidia glandulosa HHB12029 TaxID=1314781 RepID=A0A166NLE1_EXIGL|nr:Pkinase-domain-containing protein [Exidia glandulosa HHB12029]